MARKRTKGTGQVDVVIGQRVRDRRIELEMTQDDLAGAIGLTFQQIQKYENGTNRITVSRMLDIAAALKVDPCWLIKGLGAQNKKPEPLTKDAARLMSAYGEMDKGMKRHLLAMAQTLAKTGSR